MTPVPGPASDNTTGEAPTSPQQSLPCGEGQEKINTNPSRSTASDNVDDFGLPIRLRTRPSRLGSETSDEHDIFHDVQEQADTDDDNGNDVALGGHVELQRNVGKSGSQDDLVEQGQHNQGNERSQAQGSSGHNDSRQEKTEISAVEDKNETSPPKSPLALAEPPKHGRKTSRLGKGQEKSVRPSEYSHQNLAQAGDQESDEGEEDDDDDLGWQEMPALGEHDVYDDFGRLVAKGSKDDAGETSAALGEVEGFGSGYSRLQMDDDVKSSTSLDEDTGYLFKEGQNNSVAVDDELRDAASQLQTTTDLLTESQRVAYVGVVRLIIYQMMRDMQEMPMIKGSRNAVQKARDSIKKWGQFVMTRIYLHMDIDSAEQIMIEQLAEHGVQPTDLVEPLMTNARAKDSLADDENAPLDQQKQPKGADSTSEMTAPPPYEEHDSGYVPEVHTEADMTTTASKDLDIDLRWTVLCDLFLILISDESYDSRSRTLLGNVGKAMDVTRNQICRFEKRVMDALEVQEAAASKETWDESEHMEKRRKMALKKKYMVMGLATVSGGVVIGLSAGLLAPFIGAGLAAGFATIGVSGTSAFLGGASGTALITSGASLAGSTIGLRASNKRTGAVRTFEYRPLHNNKRFNLIVTVSGWMSGDLDDIRLPYSTVDPIMGDIYSVLWEPEMLHSMGDTVKVLASEVGGTNKKKKKKKEDLTRQPGFFHRTATTFRKYGSNGVNGVFAATGSPLETFISD